ncbi:MAG: TonB-dependent receptor plug domain-containing protein, partial [Ginsengibacter sp.]
MKIILTLRRISGILLTTILVFANPSKIDAQNVKEITGIIRSSKSVLQNVSVTIKNNPNFGTTTNTNGKYSIKASENSTLVFTSIGFNTVEIPVNGQVKIDVTMLETNVDLDEVVVIGYGTQKKVNVIGSVSTITSKELTVSPVSNISNALAGRLPGAIVQQSNGQPGNDGASILIRGLATLGNNEPLVVVDGIQGRDINSINVNDVESISVLKDASAAIYGARSANGVILVTTKHGKEGIPVSVNYSFYAGWLSPTQLPKMADAATYAQMIHEMQTYQGVAEPNMQFSLDDIE